MEDATAKTSPISLGILKQKMKQPIMMKKNGKEG